MATTSALDRLAEMAGLELQYWDIFQTVHVASDEAKRKILGALGIAADDDAAVEASLRALDEEPWRRPLPPVVVVGEGAEASTLLTIGRGRGAAELTFEIIEEGGSRHSFAVRPDQLALADSRRLGDEEMERRVLVVPVRLPVGYHHLVCPALAARPMRLIVAPQTCYLPEPLARGEKQWGLSAHVYALRSRHDWGIGDLSGLAGVVEAAGAMGAASVGVNPLHALFQQQPGRASPYSPSSRLFLNPIYLDVEAMPDFTRCPRAQRAVEARRDEIRTLREEHLLDYAKVTALKLAILDDVFACYVERTAVDSAGEFVDEAFRCFRESQGPERLRRFAVFEALSEHFDGVAWQRWPEGFRDPGSAEVAAFARDNRQRVAFFEYLQWQADRQLAAVQERAEAVGLPVGLYRDLAVGVDPDGADAWSDQAVVITEMQVGAPPDPFNMLGQDWGLPPLSPLAIREQGYEPFVAMLRANMRHAGALRIDHAMALLHLYWIPAGAPPSEGVYLAYPFDDLLGILALESQRNRCMVIGEDLGTVPEGFRERMAAINVLSYRVLYFEKEDENFKRPDQYPELALACVTTHDLATLAGFWKGSDIELRRDLKLYPSADVEQSEWVSRSHDRRRLLDALAQHGLLRPQPQSGAEDDPMTALSPELVAAVHHYLALSPAMLLMVQLDDVTAEEEQINLPGTVEEHPNWRRRLSVPVEDVASSPVALALERALTSRCLPGTVRARAG